MNFDIWMLVGGIGIFLFGIYLMEESLKTLSGKAFKKLIRRSTSTDISAIATGTLSTAILQSSSAVTLMVLAFVGAEIMTLTRALGVVFGSNLGTTLSSWIVATIGFKFNIESLALPLIGLGGLGLIFSGRATKASNICKLMVGFGFLFLGLDYMKKGVNELTATFDISTFKDYNVFFFVLIGFVITAIMQSSSAAMAIILTSVFGGVVDFYTASAMVIGSNLGTTLTVMLGSIGGVVAKKQVALGHFTFNTVTGIAAFIFLKPLNHLVLDVFNLKNEPAMALALFHTLFNAAGVLLFFPFMNRMADIITRLIKDKKSYHSQYIHNASTDVTEAALEAIRKETCTLLQLIMTHNLKVMNVDAFAVPEAEDPPAGNAVHAGNADKIYKTAKHIQSEIFIFSSLLQSHELPTEEAVILNSTLQAVQSGVSAAKTLKDIAHELERLDQSELGIVNSFYNDLRQNLSETYRVLYKVLLKKSHTSDVDVLLYILDKLKQYDIRFMKDMSKCLVSGEIHEEYVSSILTANRHFSLSLRQMTYAVKDLILSEIQIKEFDNTEGLPDKV